MSASTIEWTDRHDWNPVRGCTRISPGCGGPGPHGGCYAEAMAARFSDPGQWGHGFAKRTPSGGRWTGQVDLIDVRLTLPLRWSKGVPGRNKCFITSTSDPFHESLSDEAIDSMFAVMALRPDWIFQVLTKRSDRMREYCISRFGGDGEELLIDAIEAIDGFQTPGGGEPGKPLPNVWLGVSVEDQARADQRIPDLLATPAAVRWLSCEPLLGPVDLVQFTPNWGFWFNALDWVVVGGESGPRHRDNDFLSNARSLRDQCAAASVAFFGKQNVGKRPLPDDLQIREFPA